MDELHEKSREVAAEIRRRAARRERLKRLDTETLRDIVCDLDDRCRERDQTIDSLRAELARVTGERDEARNRMHVRLSTDSDGDQTITLFSGRRHVSIAASDDEDYDRCLFALLSDRSVKEPAVMKSLPCSGSVEFLRAIYDFLNRKDPSDG